uniref:Osteocalcin n=1 Tax=Pseudonaja textilis TaxID=8673 RepID=A0A670ZLL1_PSETE
MERNLPLTQGKKREPFALGGNPGEAEAGFGGGGGERENRTVGRDLGGHLVQPPAQAGAAVNPLEAQREVCELSPACDELADHIGFQEAYRQFYGPV